MAPGKLSFRHMRRAAFFIREEGVKSTFRRSRLWWQTNRVGTLRSIAPEVTARNFPPKQSAANTFSFWTESAEKSAFGVKSPSLVRQRRKFAVIGDLNLPQCRKYRVEQLAEIFSAANSDFSYAHFEDEPRCMDILQDASHLLLYRLRSTPLVSQHLYEARRLGLQILYDIDDPLFSVPAYATYGNMAALPCDLKKHFISEAPSYADVMNMADVISVSTPALQEHARAFTNRPVFVRRNFADTSTLSAYPHENEVLQTCDTFRIAFASGSHGHEMDFATIENDVSLFLSRKRTRKLVIIGHFDKNRLPADIRPQVDLFPFSDYANYLEILAACNAAIMPLADDLFNRCKSGVRVIDASSVCVPSLVGTVSDMPTLVTDGITGRILSEQSDWSDALESMASDVQGTQNMGKAARKSLEREWSAHLGAPIIDQDMLHWIRG